MRNLAAALITHERITTTVAKAKETRGFVERLITVAKRGGLHARRIVLSRLGGKKRVVITRKEKDGKISEETVLIVPKIFDVLVPRYKNRPGGYTRVIKRPYVRLGDAGPTAYLELIPEGATKEPKKAPPAPKVTEPTTAKDED
jgi:large subunit ribosomal protein L17